MQRLFGSGRSDIDIPRRGALVEEFAEHVASDVKQLVEDEDTGAKSYRYVRTGTNHFSLALTYDCIAWSRERFSSPGAVSSGHVALSDIFTKPW